MGDVEGLFAFLMARLDEDEGVAHEALRGDLPATWELEHGGVRTAEVFNQDAYVWDGQKIPIARVMGTVGAFEAETRNAEHIARHDPARVLREVEAKRRIIDIHDGPHSCGFLDYDNDDPCPTVRNLAAIHRDHPDYREDWRP